jgi:DNA-binding NtrC family response regulator
MGVGEFQQTPPVTVAIATRDRVYRDSLSTPLRRRGLRVIELDPAAPDAQRELEAVDVLIIDTDALSPLDLENVSRLHARWPLVEIVAVSGDLPIEEAVEALRSGFFTVLQHPVADDRLAETIIQAGRRHQRARTRLEELNHASYSGERTSADPAPGRAEKPPGESS